jgi:AAA+ ATPase superfamily predicted ATPase
MSKFSNLYDIDGNIINKSPQHRYTLEETEQLVDDLSKKVQENPDNEVYKVYLANAQKWLYKLYNEMSREELMKRMNFVTDSIQNAKDDVNEAEQKEIDEINKAVEELKKEYDRLEGEGTVLDSEVEQPVAVDTPVVMDEYVEPVEEVTES